MPQSRRAKAVAAAEPVVEPTTPATTDTATPTDGATPQQEPGVAFIEGMRAELQARMAELKPLVEEYTILEQAELAFTGVMLEPIKPRRGRPPGS